MPSASTKSLILLRDLRGGIHGRVWLACSRSGYVCVLKFAQSIENVKLLSVEQKIWETVWELPVRIQTFSGQCCLFSLNLI